MRFEPIALVLLSTLSFVAAAPIPGFDVTKAPAPPSDPAEAQRHHDSYIQLHKAGMANHGKVAQIENGNLNMPDNVRARLDSRTKEDITESLENHVTAYREHKAELQRHQAAKNKLVVSGGGESSRGAGEGKRARSGSQDESQPEQKKKP